MTERRYICGVCGYQHSEHIPVDQGSPLVEHCGQQMDRVFGIQTSRVAFEPYIEKNLPGGPIEMTGPAQRDAIMAKYDMTYDTYSNVERNKVKPTINDVTLDEVMTKHKKDLGEWL